jgi:hypothetical protein
MTTFKSLALSPSQQSVISPGDVDVIFYKVPELHEIHYKFIRSLQSKMNKWTPELEFASVFKEFVSLKWHLVPFHCTSVACFLFNFFCLNAPVL